MRYILALMIALPFLLAGSAWASKYDGEWEGDGIVTCQIDGGKFTFRTAISIKNRRFEKSGKDGYVTYSLEGKIDVQGRINGGKFRFSAPQVGSLGFTLFGKAKQERIDLEFEKLFMDGKIAARDRLCWGKIFLTKNIHDHEKTSESEANNKKIKTIVVNNNSSKLGDIETKLKKLKELLDKGLITADEAKAKRQKLLGITVTANQTPDSKIENTAEVVKNPDAVAVIIGNQNYGKDIPKVAYAHNDADAIRTFVTDLLGHDPDNIIDLRDATQAKLQATFGNERSHQGRLWSYLDAKGGSDVVIYYSGHGVPGQQDQKGYLLPTNADPDHPEINGYPLDLLYANLGKLEARSITVLLDACFSGGSHQGMLIHSASPILVTAREIHEGSGEIVVLTAASSDQLASWDEKAKHGLFTRYFLEGAYGAADTDGDQKIKLEEIKTYLDRTMTRRARRDFRREQEAWISGAPDTVLVQLGSP